ncbi:uncharacterized protein C11orf16 homolog [Protobothrops mucrosquamatus]|uniref:uncharacterized protein C11orf16 homolog n=1 Tax=Protobothrops mucrosquamatus TaxID=103944 RepID=UPI0007758277|nr:uncharacterized protein C11orf16 homolog [Protobothrops mucrosquamatus]
MSECTLASWPCHRCCCTVPLQAESSHRNVIVNPSSICSGCLLVHPSYGISSLLTTRCLCHSYCPFLLDAKRRTGQNLERSLDAGSPVLAKKGTDCYYYQGTIIKDLEEAEQRSFLVQFAEGQDTPSLQKAASSDILECVNGMRHSILPGDKVMAPWEPEQKRYGPGTVLQGMETRDPLREKEDEEITVSFWNGKKAKVPLGLALWISPAQWKRIVERIHLPYTSRKQLEGQVHRPGYYNCSHETIPTIPTCTLGDFQRCWCRRCCFIHPCFSGFHHTCSLLGHRQCVSYCGHCCSKYSGCWTRPSLAELTSGYLRKKFTSKPTTPFLAIEASPEVEHAAMLSSSSSSSSESHCEREKSSTKSTMIDQAVNTDSSLFKNPTLQETRRPEWKYWKRSQPTFVYKSQGANIVSSSCRKERADNKAISSTDGFPPILYNHSAIFETIEESRQRHLSMKKILSHGITSSSWGG